MAAVPAAAVVEDAEIVAGLLDQRGPTGQETQRNREVLQLGKAMWIEAKQRWLHPRQRGMLVMVRPALWV